MAAASDQIKCLMLPQQGRPVIVPNSAVAEIITQQDVRPVEASPDWLLGTGEWRGTRIPLLALDRLCGERAAAPEPTGRFVVLFGLASGSAPGFYGVRIDALPRTQTVTRESLRPAEGEPHPSEHVRQRAVLDGERECLIPDFEAIGATLAAHVRAGASPPC